MLPADVRTTMSLLLWTCHVTLFIERLAVLLFISSHVFHPARGSDERPPGDVVVDGPKWVDVCKWKSFEANCSADSVVFIDQARYGRMRLGSCLTTGYGNVGCFADVTQYVERRCAGRHHCSLQIPDVDLDLSPHLCPHELLTYLEVAYHCQPVITADDHNCTDQPLLLAPPSDSFVASIVTQQTSKGSTSCPWAINATQGQVVSFSLVDFAVKSTGTALMNDTRLGELCLIYAEISDQTSSGERRKMLVCGGTETRDRIIYTSSSAGGLTYLTVHTASANKQVYFLVRITVRCLDNRDPAGEAVVECPVARESRLTDSDCSGSEQCVGSVIELPSAPVTGAKTSPYTNQGLLIVVVIGTAMLLSFVIISVGLICLRRRSRTDSSVSVYHSACIYDMPPPNTVITAHYPVSSGSDGYRSVHAVTQSYKELYPVLASHERLAGDRDYATTLQMRQTAVAAAACDLHSHLPCSFGSPGTWACPVHGHVTLPARRSLRHHRLPLGERFYEVTTGPGSVLVDPNYDRRVPVVSQSPDSPFYHELDPNAFHAESSSGEGLGRGINMTSSVDADNNNGTLALAESD